MIKNFFTNRWFLLGLGFVLFTVVVWFVGPLIAIANYKPLVSIAARLLLILLVVLIWGAWQAYQFYQTKRASDQLMTGMIDDSTQASVQNGAAEVELLRKRIDQAVKTLKKRGGNKKWGSAYLYEIPWYMFIGAPGSGKTTALKNCGLRFPIADDGQVYAVKGVGGTRNCDWWFTDDAVFLDTAGRYTTQDSDPHADSHAWLGFLKLIKKVRVRRPLNGVIVTVSIADLLTQSDAEIDAFALSVRTRIQELRDNLDTDFSVYLMVTKTDLLAGFNEFFAPYGTEARAQVLGSTFNYQQTKSASFDFVQSFKSELALIEARLNACLVDRMQQERDNQRRAQLYAFPQQFSSVLPLLERLIEQTFVQSTYDQRVSLRGVYFTSGTQEGAPIDRVLGSLSRILRIERLSMPIMAMTPKAFFLTRLLKEVVFPEAELVGHDPSKTRKRKIWFAICYSLIVFVAIGFIGLWSVSYLQNDHMVENAQQQVDDLAAQSQRIPEPELNDWNQVLPFLTNQADMAFGYRNPPPKSVPITQSMGLYQGKRLNKMLVNSYQRSLSMVLMPRVAMFLEDQIRTAERGEIKYEALKAYLMLFDRKHRKNEDLLAFVSVAWESDQRESAAEFSKHFQAALALPNVEVNWRRDDDLVEKTRQQIASVSLADRVFARMLLLGVGDNIKPVKLSDMMGHRGTQIFVRSTGEPLSAPLPAFYTHEGYHKGFKPELSRMVKEMAEEDLWVLGQNNSSLKSEADVLALNTAVKQLYLEGYIRNWEEILSSIELKPSTSLTDTKNYAGVLSSMDSPLKKLIVGLNKQLTLAVSTDSKLTKIAKDMAIQQAKDYGSRVMRNSSQVTDQFDVPTNILPEQMVDDHFYTLRSLAGKSKESAAPIDQTVIYLNDFYQELLNVTNSDQALGSRSLDTGMKLRAEGERLPAPVSQILKALYSTSKDQMGEQKRENLSSGIQTAAKFCTQAISGQYPINKLGKQEIALVDFAKIFAPNGELDSFFNTNVRSLVDTSGRTWKPAQNTASDSLISQETINQFQNADAIKRAFFRSGPDVEFTLDIKLISSDWPALDLTYNAQQFQLTTKNSMKLVWPAQNSNTIRLAPPGSYGVAADGDWGLFRLVDQIKPEGPATSGRLRLVYQEDGQKAIIELRAGGVYSPFHMPELHNFKCPGK